MNVNHKKTVVSFKKIKERSFSVGLSPDGVLINAVLLFIVV